MSDIHIRHLSDADSDSAAAILDAAFSPAPWQEALRRSLRLQPEGMLLAEHAGVALGLVSGVDYGPFAYVGCWASTPPRSARASPAP